MYDLKWSRGSKRRLGRGTTYEAKTENGYEKWYILAWNSVRTWKATRHLPHPTPPPLLSKRKNSKGYSFECMFYIHAIF